MGHRSDESEKLLRTALKYTQTDPVYRSLGLLLAHQGREDEAIVIWQSVDWLGEEFVARGKQAETLKHYTEASVWYQRATKVSPDLRDGWYNLGLSLQSQQRWADAVYAYEVALECQTSLRVGVSDVYFQLGQIYQSDNYRDWDMALQMYNAALRLDSFGFDYLRAEVFYKRGELYGWQGRDPQQSIIEYEQALQINPYHRWARLRLGYALYWAYKEVGPAVAEINQALLYWPNDSYRKWPYRYLGDIYRDAGQYKEAIIAYQEVLRLDPSDKEVRNIIANIDKE